MKGLFKTKVLVLVSIVFLALSAWSFEAKDIDASRVELKDIKLLGSGYHPRWSPDGKKILYTSGNSIFMVNPDGSDKKRIIDGYDAAWSPDGKRIAYKKIKPVRIAILDLKTKKEYIIYDLLKDSYSGGWSGTIFDPRAENLHEYYTQNRTHWSKDGTRIFFTRTSQQYGRQAVQAINLDNLKWKKYSIDYQATYFVSQPNFKIQATGSGIWASNVDADHPFSIRLLDSYTSSELSPDLTKLVFVKAEKNRRGAKIPSVYVAKIGRASTSNIKTYEVAMGLNDGIKEKDILVVYEAKINPLNNKLVGYNEDKMKGTVLVERVGENKSRVRSYSVMENFGQNAVAMKKNQLIVYLKDPSLKEALPDTRLIARRVGDTTYSYVDENAVMSLVEELDHMSTNKYQQIFLFEVLGNLGDERAVGPIVRKIENGSWYSLYACAALLKIGNPYGIKFAVKYICQNFRNGFAQGTDNFVKALGELKDPKVLSYYIQELRREAGAVHLSPKHFIVVTIKKAEETLAKLEPSKLSQVKFEATKSAIPSPKLIKHVFPVYPRIARGVGLAGEIGLTVTIDSRGRVVNARAETIEGADRVSLVARLTICDAAVRAVKQWIFEPTSKGMTFTVTVPFRLK